MQSSAMAAVTPTLSMTLKYGDPVTHHKISSKFVKNFFLYHSNRQTDRHRVKHIHHGGGNSSTAGNHRFIILGDNFAGGVQSGLPRPSNTPRQFTVGSDGRDREKC